MSNSNDNINHDLVAIGQELREEIVRSIDNACKKVNNLKIGGPDARMLISLCLAQGWAWWLCALTSKERVELFQSGTQMISEDLLEKMQDEIRGSHNGNSTTQ